jgi:OmpA family
MGASLILFLVLSTTQAVVHYTSPNVTFRPVESYVVCSNCPSPTALEPLPTRHGGTLSFNFPVKQTAFNVPLPAMRPASGTAAPALPTTVTSPPTGAGLPGKPAFKSAPATALLVSPVARTVVYFDLNSAALKAAARLKLDGLDKKSIIDVIGYTDSKGSKKYNDSLALKRASAVISYLGVSAPISGRGKCCYADPANDALNRRVQVDYKTTNCKIIKGRRGEK